MMEREIEVKLLAQSVELLTEIEKRTSLAGLPLTPAAQRLQEDTYFDTEDFALLRAGFSLRIRRRDDVVQATLKSVPGRDRRTLLRDRTEVEAVLDPGAAPEIPPGEIRDFVARIAGDRPLSPVVRIRTKRHLFRLGPQPAAVLCADRAWILRGDGGEPVDGFLEVEVEDKGGGSAVLERAGNELMDEYGLRPSSLSKFERGLAALGLLERARGDGGER